MGENKLPKYEQLSLFDIMKINNMSDDLKGAVITAIVTGTISIVGFIVTYNSMKKNFKNELAKAYSYAYNSFS